MKMSDCAGWRFSISLSGYVGPLCDPEGNVIGRAWIDKDEASQSSTACQHRGDDTRLVECAACKGSVNIKLFSCAVYGECAIARRTEPGVGVCSQCPERLPPID
jgi:hypothetical protein